MGGYRMGASAMAVAAIIVFLAACGNPSNASSSAAAATGGTARPSATATAPSCKLPIFYPPENGTVQGGWVNVPGGQTQQDATGSFARSGNLVTSKAQPALTGDGPTFYDRARTRWVPVGQKAISDDGAAYAYMDAGNAGNAGHQRIHLVTVSNAQDRTVNLPAARPFETWNILQYTGGRIYLTRVGSEGPGAPGLWQLDPGSGQVQQLFGDKTPVAIQGQSAWFESVNPTDAQALTNQQSGDKLPDQVERRQLPSGPAVTWLYKPGTAVQVIGVDNGGHPFVAVSHGQAPTDATELFAVPAPNLANRIYQGTVADIDALAVNFTDNHGTWFGGNGGVYLYSNGATINQVSTTAARPAGRCV